MKNKLLILFASSTAVFMPAPFIYDKSIIMGSFYLCIAIVILALISRALFGGIE